MTKPITVESKLTEAGIRFKKLPRFWKKEKGKSAEYIHAHQAWGLINNLVKELTQAQATARREEMERIRQVVLENCDDGGEVVSGETKNILKTLTPDNQE